MYSTDFIFRQQENPADNQNCHAGFRPLCNKIPMFMLARKIMLGAEICLEIFWLQC